jgi:hypothetical protein
VLLEAAITVGTAIVSIAANGSTITVLKVALALLLRLKVSQASREKSRIS